MAAAVLHPDLGSEYAQLQFPHEAAFLATARDVLPHGMLGLLICCIFAASLTDMGAVLNWGSGLLLRNFYLPVINPQCSEKKLMKLSRLAAFGLGAVLIVFALVISRYRSLGLFDLLNQVGTSLLMPLAIPAFLGLYYKRTPSWSAWTTAVLGLVISLVVSPKPLALIAEWITGTKTDLVFITPAMLSWLPGLGGPYSGEEQTQFGIIATVALVGGACVAWFFFTSLFYEKCAPEYKASVEEFFARTRTPLLENAQAGTVENRKYPVAIGQLCMIYGAFIMLLVLIPNSIAGRLCYVGCGGAMLGLGFLIARIYRKKTASAAADAAPAGSL
jgi:hypothetical protein